MLGTASYTMQRYLLPCRYMAPEQLAEGALHDVRSDAWALGIMALELLSGCMLDLNDLDDDVACGTGTSGSVNAHGNDNSSCSFLQQLQSRHDGFSRLSPSAISFLQQCLQPVPLRWSVHKLLQGHNFLQQC